MRKPFIGNNNFWNKPNCRQGTYHFSPASAEIGQNTSITTDLNQYRWKNISRGRQKDQDAHACIMQNEKLLQRGQLRNS
jgi:hypothetical protein